MRVWCEQGIRAGRTQKLDGVGMLTRLIKQATTRKKPVTSGARALRSPERTNSCASPHASTSARTGRCSVAGPSWVAQAGVPKVAVSTAAQGAKAASEGQDDSVATA
eukprot:scaffold23366_cov112-Isochrysis_galbana.AAC.4